ncbi:hypothetical protein ACH5RR_006431, partial [Cinchona calisaya]
MGDKDFGKTENIHSKTLDEISDPHSLHPSDHPGVVLVSKVLEGDNYNTWSRAMRISLSAKTRLDLLQVRSNGLLQQMT